MDAYGSISKGIATLVSLLLALLNVFGILTNSYDPSLGSTITYASSTEEVAQLMGMCDDGVLTTCGGDCGHNPSIVVPGIGQSESTLLDANNQPVLDESGEVITGWPLYINADVLVDQLAAPLVTAISTQQDNGFTDDASQKIADALWVNETGLNGLPVNNVHVTKYYKSVAACTDEEKAYIYDTIPLKNYTAQCGEDHLYFFAYNSFGDTIGIAEELYAYIQMVKAQTGHDKVNLVPISLGGTVFNALIELHPEVAADLGRVVMIIPALDGSQIVGDVFRKNLSFNEEEMLYRDLFPALLNDEYTGYVANLGIRLLPKQVLNDLLSKTVDKLLPKLVTNCPGMWALLPSEYYPAMATQYLSGADHDYLRARTAKYYEAQVDSDANILALKSAGVEVFDICDYSVPLVAIAGSYKAYNADGIIQVDSTSMGATTSLIGETLPTDYVPVGSKCTDPTHNHISPDGSLDASTGLLPETTFYFYKQNHESTARNNIIMNLAINLLKDNTIADIYTAERYPQFMYLRNTRGFYQNDVPLAQTVLNEEAAAPGTYDAQLVTDLQAAIDLARAMEDDGRYTTEQVDAMKEQLYNCLVRAGKRNAPEEEDQSVVYLTEFLKAASDGMYQYYGPVGYSDFKDSELAAIIQTYEIIK